MSNKQNSTKKTFNFTGIVAFVIAVLLLLVLVPINMIFSYNDKNFDMTAKSQYTFTDTTLQLLDDTKDKQIDIYFLCPIEYLRDVPEYLALYHQLMELDKRDNIKLICSDINENPQLNQTLNPDGLFSISTGDIVVKCGNISKHIAANRIYPYTYVNNSSEDTMSTYAGEELLAGAIKIVTGDSLPTIYFMTGHGEPTIEDSYETISKKMKTDNYDVISLDLASEPSVPGNAALVVLSGPTEDISREEADKLIEYSENGGNIAFLIPPCETEGRFSNIELVLEKFEIGMDYNYVSETYTKHMMNNREYTQDAHYFNVDYTAPSDGYTVNLTGEILNLIETEGLTGGISNTRSFYQLNPMGSATIEKSSIITSTYAEDGYTTKSEPFGGNKETAREAEKLNDATVQLELAFYSYNKVNGSKLVVFGTDDIINWNTLSESVILSQQLFLNSVTWMYNPDINMNIGNKDNAYDYLTFHSADEATSTLRIFTVVPIVIAVLGLIVWLKRRHS